MRPFESGDFPTNVRLRGDVGPSLSLALRSRVFSAREKKSLKIAAALWLLAIPFPVVGLLVLIWVARILRPYRR